LKNESTYTSSQKLLNKSTMQAVILGNYDDIS